MWLAERKVIPPPEWHHEPTLTDNNGYTVALYLADNHIIPPAEWHHDADI